MVNNVKIEFMLAHWWCIQHPAYKNIC